MIKFNWRDWLIIAGVGLNAGARLATSFIVSSASNTVATAQVLETNPLAKWAVASYLLNFIALFIGLGLLITYYIWLRREAEKSTNYKFFYEAFTIILFLLLFFDFINGFGTVLGILFNK